MSERILLLGSGGREHALAKALSSSASCSYLWCAPGNPGIASVAELVSMDINDPDSVVRWCTEHQPSLVVVGPEVPLMQGIVNALVSHGFATFGPTKEAARLETSKGFAKDFMQKHHIPTASYRRCSTKEEALLYVADHPLPVVIKYDGLAAGKGVIVATTTEEARDAVSVMFDGAFGNDGVVIEGFLEGVEASVFAITDGKEYVTLAPCHDHKRVGNGDVGKNTGGMGAVAPSPRVSAATLRNVELEIIEPTIAGMANDGVPFVGCLYCGVMIDQSGKPSVVEFNVRFGDPETQVLLSVLRADVAALLASAARGSLAISTITSTCDGAAACVVLASNGYPDRYEVGYEVTGIQDAERSGCLVFHAGTSMVADNDSETSRLVTNGGRVLTVTAHAEDVQSAVSKAYEACEKITFTGKYLRTDIGRTA